MAWRGWAPEWALVGCSDASLVEKTRKQREGGRELGDGRRNGGEGKVKTTWRRKKGLHSRDDVYDAGLTVMGWLSEIRRGREKEAVQRRNG